MSKVRVNGLHNDIVSGKLQTCVRKAQQRTRHSFQSSVENYIQQLSLQLSIRIRVKNLECIDTVSSCLFVR